MYWNSLVLWFQELINGCKGVYIITLVINHTFTQVFLLKCFIITYCYCLGAWTKGTSRWTCAILDSVIHTLSPLYNLTSKREKTWISNFMSLKSLNQEIPVSFTFFFFILSGVPVCIMSRNNTRHINYFHLQ